MRAKMAHKLLKRLPKYNQKKIMNVMTGDESWIHFFKPYGKTSNQVWLTKDARRPCIAKRIANVKRLCMPYFPLLKD